MSDTQPEWDAQTATELVGKRVLIGITFVTGDCSEQEQMFGAIAETDPQRGVRIALQGSRAGEDYWLPPDLRSFFVASPGEYRLRSTGEVVVDPDWIATWTIERPS